MYFSTTFPLVVILILLIRGVTLEGAKNGLEFFIGSQSNLSKLTEAQVRTQLQMLAVVSACLLLKTDCPWHTDQTNPNKTVDRTDNLKLVGCRSNLKMESEEDLYANLETLPCMPVFEIDKMFLNMHEKL